MHRAVGLFPGQCGGISYHFGLGPQTKPGNTYSYTFTGTGSQTFTLTNHGTLATSLGWGSGNWRPAFV